MEASAAQRRWWLLAQLEESNGAHNIVAELPGHWSPEDLEAMAQRLVDAHPILRTAVRRTPEGSLETVEFPPAGVRAEVLRGATALGVGFAPTEVPALRAVLFDDATAALVGAPHAVDPESLGALRHEPAAGGPSYAESVAAEVAWLSTPEAKETIEWWAEQLRGAPAIVELPADHRRPPVQSFASATITETLDGAALDRLRGATGLGTDVLVLTATFACLHRWTGGGDDLVIGVRHHNEPAGGSVAVGPLSTDLPVRVTVAEGTSFADLAAAVDRALREAITHAVRFDVLLEQLSPERDLSCNPMFQVRAGTAGPERTWVQGTDVDLDVRLADGAQLKVSYATDLFDATSATRLTGHIARLLRDAAQDTALDILSLALLGEEERRLVLEEGNRTDAAFEDGPCLHHLIARQAAQRPDAEAVCSDGHSFTYRQLDERANQLAHRLAQAGVGRGSLVGVCVERGALLPLTILGIHKAGAAYVPIEPTYPADRIDFMVTDAGLDALVTQASVRAALPPVTVPLIDLEADAADLDGQPTHDPAVEVTNRDLAYVIYTSGSTGRPKGVLLEHRGVVNLLTFMARHPGLEPGQTMIGPTTPAFDLSVPDWFLPLTTGARLAVVGPEVASDPARLAAALEHYDADVIQLTPASWRMLLDAGWSGRPNMRVVCGGEGFGAALAHPLAARVAELWNFYGPTEATVWTTCARLTDQPDPQPMGTPLPNYRCYVLDRLMQPVPVGVPGELHIGGEGLARGYHRRPDLTAERFVPDPFGDGTGRLYKTGDLARRRGDGSLEFAGRVDHQVKIRGFRIELGEIESALRTHPDVQEAAVLARPDTRGDLRLVAYVVTGAARPDPTELRGHLSTQLAAYMVPTTFVAMDTFPLTPNGKLDRKALPEPDAAPAADYVAPRGPIEALVADLWAEVLGVPQVGATDDFFVLGGHSLLVAQVAARLPAVLGVQVPLRVLFENPTVEAAALALTAEMADALDDGEDLVAELED